MHHLSIREFSDTSCSAHDEAVAIVFTETGRPKAEEPTGLAGHGIKLVERSVTSRLRGSIKYDWAEDSLVVTLRIDPDRLVV